MGEVLLLSSDASTAVLLVARLFLRRALACESGVLTARWTIPASVREVHPCFPFQHLSIMHLSRFPGKSTKMALGVVDRTCRAFLPTFRYTGYRLSRGAESILIYLHTFSRIPRAAQIKTPC